MNRFLISLLAFALIPLWCWGQRTLDLNTGVELDGITASAPTRAVTNVDDGVIVTYTFSQIELRNDPLFSGKVLCSMPGFGENTTGAEPAVLYHNDSFIIPDNTSASIEILESSYKDFSYALGPARELLSDDNYDYHSTDNVLPIKAYTGSFPSTTVTTADIQTYRGMRMLSVQISPTQYINQSATLRIYTKLKFKIKYNTTRAAAQQVRTDLPDISSDDNLLRNITSNYQADESDSPTTQSLVRDYLVLGTSRTEIAAKTFKQWKQRLGFRVHMIIRNDWTSDLVRSSVREFYESHPSLYYLLILGDHTDIPAMEFYDPTIKDYPNYVSDYYYGCMDDDDKIADIYCGRIPISNKTHCERTLKKIKSYIYTPVQDETFYATGVNCTQFQDLEGDGFEDRRFAQTAEEIRDYVIGQGKTVKRIYYTPPYVTPKFWNNDIFSNGAAIPDELKKPGFAWNGSATDITTAINEGAFYVLHRGHGGPTGWGEPSYTTDDFAALKNDTKLPVVFSINCLTGRFNNPTECFASGLLRHIRGCSAVFAATNASYSGLNDALVCGMFDAIWPYPGLRPDIKNAAGSTNMTPTPTYTLGQILEQGLMRMAEMYNHSKRSVQYTREIFHCFGDPSMEIYTETPTEFSNVEITRNKDGVEVYLPTDYARITFYDEVADSVVCTIGRRASFKTLNPQNITVSVSRHNKIPYLEMAPQRLYFQNETISGPKSYNSKFITIGSEVLEDEPSGAVTFKSGDVTLKAKKLIIEPKTTISINCNFKIESRHL